MQTKYKTLRKEFKTRKNNNCIHSKRRKCGGANKTIRYIKNIYSFIKNKKKIQSILKDLKSFQNEITVKYDDYTKQKDKLIKINIWYKNISYDKYIEIIENNLECIEIIYKKIKTFDNTLSLINAMVQEYESKYVKTWKELQHVITSDSFDNDYNVDTYKIKLEKIYNTQIDIKPKCLE